MEFRTIVDIQDPGFRIMPCEEILFVGSCFAESIGQRFRQEGFPVTINPFGTMYNPASILHTIKRLETGSFQTAFLTLGTNHVYRLKETGEIVDNCQKRPQSLFTEEELTVDECAAYLQQAVAVLRHEDEHGAVPGKVLRSRGVHDLIQIGLRIGNLCVRGFEPGLQFRLLVPKVFEVVGPFKHRSFFHLHLLSVS